MILEMEKFTCEIFCLDYPNPLKMLKCWIKMEFF